MSSAGPWLRRQAPTLLLAAACLLFLVRGVGRGLSNGYDFVTPFAQAGAWLEGTSPYDAAQVERVLTERAPGRPGVVPPHTPLVFPPTTLIAPMLVAADGWPLARSIWVLLSAAVYLAAIVGASAIALPGARQRARRQVVVASSLAAVPVQTGLSLGQLAVISAACIVWSIARTEKDDRPGDSLCLASACLVKPPLGASAFLAAMLFRRRWAAGIGGLAVILAAALSVWLLPDRLEDLRRWRAQVETWVAASPDLDPLGAWAWQRLDLTPIAARLIPEPRAAAAVGWCFLAGIGGWLAISMWSGQRETDRWAMATSVVAAFLTAGYHRYYDLAALMPVAILWLARMHPFRAATGWLAAACTAGLAVPTQTVCHAWGWTDFAPPSSPSGRLLEGLFAGHQALLLVALAILAARSVTSPVVPGAQARRERAGDT